MKHELAEIGVRSAISPYINSPMIRSNRFLSRYQVRVTGCYMVTDRNEIVCFFLSFISMASHVWFYHLFSHNRNSCNHGSSDGIFKDRRVIAALRQLRLLGVTHHHVALLYDSLGVTHHHHHTSCILIINKKRYGWSRCCV